MRIPLLIVLSFCGIVMQAQDFSNKGKDFWIAYGNHVRMFNSGGDEKMELYITSDVATKGTVTIGGIGVDIPFSVSANQITTLAIPRQAALLDEGVYEAGIHVKADDPIVVYSFIYVGNISGATLCLPTNSLGREYYSINYHQVSNEPNSYSYFFVIAADTGLTTVQINPATPTKAGRAAGVPYTVQLRQGQVYQVLSASDLSGSSIRSISNGTTCKRIAVFSGSGKIAIGCGSGSTSDNLYQQMYPISTWGKTYITTPSINLPSLSSQNNYYRIFKSEPSAQVKVDGVAIASNYFVNGQYTDLPPGKQVSYIESDKPILVAQYFPTQGCAGNTGEGDPEMIFLNPLEQTISSVTLNSMQPSSNTNIDQHYINVVIKNIPSLIQSFTVDGVRAGNFKPVPYNSQFAYAQIVVSRGTHTLKADSGFNAIAYGFGSTESYGYSAGTNLKDLYQFVSIRNQYATVNIPAGCRNSPFKFSMTLPYQPVKIKWAFGGLFSDTTVFNPVPDSSFTVNGKRLHSYTLNKFYVISRLGTYPITLIADNPTPDGCSGEQEINYDLQIFERPSADFTLVNTACVNDSVKATDITNGNGRAVIRWNWDFGDGKYSIPNPVHKYKTAGTHLIKFSTITDIGCISDTVQKPVVLTAQPIALFNAASPACTEKPTRFTDLSTPANNIKSWSWDFGDGSSATTNSPTHIFRDAKNYKVRLIVETNAGCISEPLEQNLPVFASPRPDFSTPDVCLDDPFAEFFDSSRISDGSEALLSYLWNFGDGDGGPGNPNTAINKNPRHQYRKTGMYHVNLRVTSKDGCISDTSKSFTVNGAFPKAAFEVKEETRLCSNEEILLVDRSTVDFGNITRIEIYWNYATDPTEKTIDENPAAGKQYKHKYLEFGDPVTKEFQLVYIAFSGASCINQVSRKINVSGVPKIAFTPVDPVCEEISPFPLRSAREVFGYQGGGVYGGTGVSAPGVFNPGLAGDGNHTISYTFSATNGCSVIAQQQIQVLPKPGVNAGPDRYMLEGETILINATADPQGKYLWLPVTAIQDNSKLTPEVSPVENIRYKLQVTGVNGCVSSDEMSVKVLKKVKVPNAFSPNGDAINDTWIIEHLEDYPGATVAIFNRYGQQVFFANGYSKAWDGNHQGKPLPSGTYYWVIHPKNGRAEMKGSVTIIR